MASGVASDGCCTGCNGVCTEDVYGLFRQGFSDEDCNRPRNCVFPLWRHRMRAKEAFLTERGQELIATSASGRSPGNPQSVSEIGGNLHAS